MRISRVYTRMIHRRGFSTLVLFIFNCVVWIVIESVCSLILIESVCFLILIESVCSLILCHCRSEVDPESPQQEADARRLFEGMLQALSDVREI